MVLFRVMSTFKRKQATITGEALLKHRKINYFDSNHPICKGTNLKCIEPFSTKTYKHIALDNDWWRTETTYNPYTLQKLCVKTLQVYQLVPQWPKSLLKQLTLI